MFDYAVVIEFARDVVDDERHNELDNTCQLLVDVGANLRAYLNDNANENKSFVFTL